jgi:D-serine deaminase-like pyridoxal phosphate-dependent protein
MNPQYYLHDPRAIYSPALLFYKDLICRNIAQMVAIAGHPQRLRPHVKTHKTREIIRLEIEAGITKHKCATLAEAELLAQTGVPDVLLAYPMVGPNCGRLAQLIRTYPECHFSVLADDPQATQTLSEVLKLAGASCAVLLDLDVGQHRTGIPPGDQAVALYESFQRLEGLRPGGLHAYDGHQHQASPVERQEAVGSGLRAVLQFRTLLEQKGLPVPRLVLGGTPTFLVYAQLDLPGLECSPGTCVLYDHGYGSRFADLSVFQPAALLLTRVVSRPTPTRLTFDLGYKAVASDPSLENRCVLLDFPPYQVVVQNEEHLVVETPAAGSYPVGHVAYAVPTHICPTCALHKSAVVVEQGRVIGHWEIAARDRVLTI